VPKIQKPESEVKKRIRSDIKWSNLCGDQVTYFVDWTKNPHVENSCYNRKKIRTTFHARHIICVSPTNEGKTQIWWATIIGQKVWKWTWANNAPPDGSPYHVPNCNKMTMRSPCQWTWKKYMIMGVNRIVKLMKKIWSKKPCEYRNS
jgi:hypothetical protein